MPNTSANPNLREDTVSNSAVSYRAEDRTDPSSFFIEGSLRIERGETILSFLEVAELPDGTRGSVRGFEFFDAMMNHFGSSVNVIEGEWTRTNPNWVTNLQAFNRASLVLAKLEDAAAATPTGKYAARLNFTKIEIVRSRPVGAIGQFNRVVVRFRR